MYQQVEFDTHILGGLPVTVRADVCPPESDVGIDHSYAANLEFFWGTGKSYRPLPQSMYNKLSARDWDLLEEEALDAC